MKRPRQNQNPTEDSPAKRTKSSMNRTEVTQTDKARSVNKEKKVAPVTEPKRRKNTKNQESEAR